MKGPARVLEALLASLGFSTENPRSLPLMALLWGGPFAGVALMWDLRGIQGGVEPTS